MRRALVVLLLAVPAFADTGPHQEGQYGGVTPGESQPRDASGKPARSRRPPPKGTLTWIGFTAKDGGAEVFFQSVAPFEVSQRVSGGTLIVHLGLTRLGHNTWRQIDTRFFDNPLSGIVARAVGAVRATRGRKGHPAGIDVRIAFKSATDAREAAVRTATEADGMSYVYLTFPEGSEPKPATTAPDAGPKPRERPESQEPPAPQEPTDKPAQPPDSMPKS